MFNLKMVNEYQFELEKTGEMIVPGIIYASKNLLDKFTDDEPIQQLKNVASLPGITGKALAMPDIHLGYGFPIGGVAAFNYDDGIISPGGVGYDINCGVTLLSTEIPYDAIKGRIKDLINEIYKNVPVGIENKSSFRINENDENEILSSGLKWAYGHGFATDDDILMTEENGAIETDSGSVSERALKRGKNELGTLGAGNHFLEIQKIDNIYDKNIAEYFKLNNKNNVAIMIHTGSRGLGHQVATDYVLKLNECNSAVKSQDKQLISAYINSKLGQSYIDAMNAAANFGFVNRQIIVYKIRNAFKKILGNEFNNEISMVYSLAHNMAKVEEHTVEGKKMKLMVHRKGATRALPKNVMKGHFESTGHPVLIPGSMGTSSYVLAGNVDNINSTFSSSCHGAGRLMSRKKSSEHFNAESVKNNLAEMGIYIKSASSRGISEESPGSYKDIDEVIKVMHGAHIADPVVKLIPVGVMKG